MSDLTVAVLRELFRNLAAFRALYESEGIDVIHGPDGREYSLWDLEALYRKVNDLPPRQAQAIHLCLVANVKERDVAVRMGVSPTNPVAMYATSGLEKLVARANSEGLFLSPRRGWLRCRRCQQVWTFDLHDVEGPRRERLTDQIRTHVCEVNEHLMAVA